MSNHRADLLERLPDGRLSFDCPGCGFMHAVSVGEGPGQRWGWNGSMGRPTFTPSILVTGVEQLTDDEVRMVLAGQKIEPRPMACHSFVTDGQIQFLGDCTHQLAGQTVPIPPQED